MATEPTNSANEDEPVDGEIVGPDDVEADKPKALERAGAQLQRLTLNAVENGVGPISGSRVYAEERLAHANGDVEKAIRRIVIESIAAAGATGS